MEKKDEMVRFNVTEEVAERFRRIYGSDTPISVAVGSSYEVLKATYESDPKLYEAISGNPLLKGKKEAVLSYSRKEKAFSVLPFLALAALFYALGVNAKFGMLLVFLGGFLAAFAGVVVFSPSWKARIMRQVFRKNVGVAFISCDGNSINDVYISYDGDYFKWRGGAYVLDPALTKTWSMIPASFYMVNDPRPRDMTPGATIRCNPQRVGNIMMQQNQYAFLRAFTSVQRYMKIAVILLAVTALLGLGQMAVTWSMNGGLTNLAGQVGAVSNQVSNLTVSMVNTTSHSSVVPLKVIS